MQLPYTIWDPIFSKQKFSRWLPWYSIASLVALSGFYFFAYMLENQQLIIIRSPLAIQLIQPNDTSNINKKSKAIIEKTVPVRSKNKTNEKSIKKPTKTPTTIKPEPSEPLTNERDINQSNNISQQLSNNKLQNRVTSETIPQQTVVEKPNLEPLFRLTHYPKFSNRVEPLYPESERMIGKEAKVVAEVTINSQGTVIDVRISKSGGQAFDDAVVTALEHSDFIPGYIDERPVTTKVTQPYLFKLD